MKNTSTFHSLFTRARESLAYAVEGAIISFTEQVVSRMKGLNINRSGLAGKLDSSPAYVTKFLGGETNFTLESMVKVAGALDSEIKIELVPKSSPEAWINLLKQASPNPAQHTAWRCWKREQIQADGSQIIGLGHSRQEIIELSY
jgi:plasmid maintenance system antidote protein VapI